jgi:hypothetical protein
LVLEDWKIKISVLWLVGMLAALTRALIQFLEPGVIEQIMAGQFEGQTIGTELMLLLAIIFLIPLIMAFLSLVLRDSVNRWANIIVILVYLVFNLVLLARYLMNSSAYAVLLNLTGDVAAVLIVWYVWKSKQKT